MSNNNLIVKELPNIEYDKALLVPEVIERKKWNIIYIFAAVLGIILSIFFTYAVKLIESKKYALSAQIISYCNNKPKIDKLKVIWSNLKIPDIMVNQFMLESLFFVDAKNFEIINSIKSFFNSEDVKALVWPFEMSNVVLSSESTSAEWINKIPLKLEWKFAAFTDFSNMLSILNKMIPLIIIERIEFTKWNGVVFKWYLYNFNKNIFVYDYWKKYQDINELLKLKEQYKNNKAILKQILMDKDLWLDKMWVTEIYNCNQYADILKINKLIDFKKTEIDTCQDIEKLVIKNQKELDLKFENFIKKTATNTNSDMWIVLPTIDYTESELWISCNDLWSLKLEWWNLPQQTTQTSEY